MKKDSAILKYTCRLLQQRMNIINQSLNDHRLITKAEIAEIKWIDEKAKLISCVQHQKPRKENIS